MVVIVVVVVVVVAAVVLVIVVVAVVVVVVVVVIIVAIIMIISRQCTLVARTWSFRRPHEPDAMSAPPQAEMEMVLGKFRIPLQKVTLVTENGEPETHSMVILRHPGLQVATRASDEISTPLWLWQALGIDKKRSHGHAGWTPMSLPLISELKETIQAKRRKRTRSGLFKDMTGALVPQLLQVDVRSQSLLVTNSLKPMAANFGDSLELMNWMLQQLWLDIQNMSPPAPRGVVRANSLAQVLEEMLKNTTEEMRNLGGVKWAVFCKSTNRFKVQCEARNRPVYLFLKRFRDLAKEIANEDDLTEDALADVRTTLADAVTCMRIKLINIEEDQAAAGSLDGDGGSGADEQPAQVEPDYNMANEFET